MDNDILPDSDERRKNAQEIGKTLYTEKNWNRIIEGIKSLDPNFASFIENVPYGSVYPRKKLDLQKREIIAITALCQLNLKPQLKSHIIAALNVGISKEEILEVFLHLAMFIGFPIVLEGLKVAKEVFDRKGL